MSLEQLRQFALKILTDHELAAICSSARAADADDQASIARDAGYEVYPADLVNCQGGALVENVDEDFFMKTTWWTLVEDIS
ncbi:MULTISPECIES: Nif11 family protein [Aphanothece]|uniref:Nif11 family protein n=1 Tax=Aphanothece TaxID=1121 RepID=UPI003984B6EA